MQHRSGQQHWHGHAQEDPASHLDGHQISHEGSHNPGNDVYGFSAESVTGKQAPDK
jgi:hypothetical protein